MSHDADDSDLRPRRGDSAKSMMLTVLGEFVLPASSPGTGERGDGSGGAGGSGDDAGVWTGTLVDALVAIGYRDRNARQVLTRLRDDGRIRSERQGRRTRWLLTDDGRALLEAGAERIYRFGRRAESWDGRWLLVQCSVPEVLRRERRLLQTRLSFEGFGFLSPTVAVSPYCELEPAANRVLAELELAELAVVVAGTTGTLSPDATILQRAWDLDALRRDYGDFVERFETADPVGPQARFAELVHLVHTWRGFPFRDPEIPVDLLPDDWVGLRAQALFEELRARWAPEAATYFKELDATNGA